MLVETVLTGRHDGLEGGTDSTLEHQRHQARSDLSLGHADLDFVEELPEAGLGKLDRGLDAGDFFVVFSLSRSGDRVLGRLQRHIQELPEAIEEGVGDYVRNFLASSAYR